MGTKRGQALMELAIGLFSVALIVSAMCGFTAYIVKSLKAQNSVRLGGSSRSDSVTVDDFAAKYIFGTSSLKIECEVKMPERTILR